MSAPYRILCAIEGSPGTHAAVELVAALPHRSWDEVIVASHPEYILAASPEAGGALAGVMRRRRDAAEAAVRSAVARLGNAGVKARGVVCEGLDTPDALLRAAESAGADLVVVGSRRRGPWTSIFLGSVARSLAILSPVPVLVVRGPAVAPLRVLAAVDGSPSSDAALAAFGRLPHAEGTTIELVHVLTEHDWAEADDEELVGIRASVEYDEEQRARSLLDRVRLSVGPGVDTSVRVERGHVGERILARAAEIDTQLIVVGMRGLSAPRRPFWGSTAEQVVTQAPCTVLIAPPAPEGPNGA